MLKILTHLKVPQVLRGRRQNHDIGVRTAGRLEKLAQHDALADLVLGAADRHQQARPSGGWAGIDCHTLSSTRIRGLLDIETDSGAEGGEIVA